MKYIGLLAGIAMGSSLVSGCVYDDMEECPGTYYGKIFVENHWEYAPDAKPEGMAYYFFPDGGGEPWRFDLPGREGGEIKIPTGAYHFLMINDDTSTVAFSNEDDYDDMSASTLAGSLFDGAGEGEIDVTKLPQLSGVEDQKVLMCPDMMWGYAGGGVNVELREDDTVIPAYPRPMVCNYHFDIMNVVNLDGVARMSGAMSGMAESIDLSSLARSAEAVIHPLRAWKQGDDSIHGDFLTYGLSSAAGMKNYLFLFVWLTDGKRYIYRFDVTSQAVGAPDPMDVWLRIDGLTLPESEPGETGAFDVTVDGWTTIDINLTS